MARSRPFLTASEIGAYTFCPQAWYLQRHRVQPSSVQTQKLTYGVAAHKVIGRRTDRLRLVERLQAVLLLVVFVLLMVILAQVATPLGLAR